MTFQNLKRSICPTSKLPLWARVSNGEVTGVCNSHVPDDERPAGATWRDLPLFGPATEYDPVTQVWEGKPYIIGDDRVVADYTVRPKTAAELLAEISWWYAAVHSKPHAVAGRSPSQVNDAARRMMAEAH